MGEPPAAVNFIYRVTMTNVERLSFVESDLIVALSDQSQHDLVPDQSPPSMVTVHGMRRRHES